MGIETYICPECDSIYTQNAWKFYVRIKEYKHEEWKT